MASRQRAQALPEKRSSRSTLVVRKKLDFVAVCIVGYKDRVPRYSGDNELGRAVRAHTTRNPVGITAELQPEQPYHELACFGWVWCETERHAKRLKAELDVSLLGDGNENRLRYAWRELDHDEPAWAWHELLCDALRRINETEDFEVFDNAAAKRRIEHEKYR